MKRRRGRQNPLLAVPEQGVHALGTAGAMHFQRMVGRPVRAEDYHGVHTTGDIAIAAVYAHGAVKSAPDPNAYPVVVAIDVEGLEALPDVDALARAAELLDDRSIRESWQGYSLDEARDQWEYEMEWMVGDDVADAILSHSIYEGGPMEAFDDDEAWDRWLETGEYSAEDATRLVNQRRYLTDIGLDRVTGIEALRTWWPTVMEDPYDEESEGEVERIEGLGYRVLTIEDILNGQAATEELTIYAGEKSATWPEYHGTSSWHIARAFPELDVPPSPFPVREENTAAIRRRVLR